VDVDAKLSFTAKEVWNRVQIEFVHHDMPETISPDIALCFFRIVQEALNNIVKHSGAKQARIEFSGASSIIRLRIVDAGVGFDPGSRTARGGWAWRACEKGCG
jgi:signal transduction histidine kinase